MSIVLFLSRDLTARGGCWLEEGEKEPLNLLIFDRRKEFSLDTMKKTWEKRGKTRQSDKARLKDITIEKQSKLSCCWCTSLCVFFLCSSRNKADMIRQVVQENITLTLYLLQIYFITERGGVPEALFFLKQLEAFWA